MRGRLGARGDEAAGGPGEASFDLLAPGASPAAGDINGVVLPVDDGWSAV
ncbi:hypothetical protein ACFYSF_34650 [Streptomyces canus]